MKRAKKLCFFRPELVPIKNLVFVFTISCDTSRAYIKRARNSYTSLEASPHRQPVVAQLVIRIEIVKINKKNALRPDSLSSNTSRHL